MKIGNNVKLIRPKKFWLIETKGKRVGCLNEKISESISKNVNGLASLNGFVCSNIYRWTFNETIEYDNKHKTTYSNDWTAAAKKGDTFT